MCATSDQKNVTGPTTYTITDSQQKNAETGQIQRGDIPSGGIPIYLLRDKSVLQPLNVPERNAIAHKSPNLLKHVVAEAFQRQANKEGLYKDKDCVVRWKPSAIPFHIEFQISVSGNTCQHLASVRSNTAKDPVSTRLHTLLTSLTVEIGSVRKGSCSTRKSLFKQATCKSTVMKRP